MDTPITFEQYIFFEFLSLPHFVDNKSKTWLSGVRTLCANAYYRAFLFCALCLWVPLTVPVLQNSRQNAKYKFYMVSNTFRHLTQTIQKNKKTLKKLLKLFGFSSVCLPDVALRTTHLCFWVICHYITVENGLKDPKQEEKAFLRLESVLTSFQ